VTPGRSPAPPTQRNIRAIAEIEAKGHRRRGRLERASDYVTRFAGSPWFVLLHLLWFATWIGVNAVSAHPLDPYPFTFLTFLVSLEAIFLTSFVLTSQNHAERQERQSAALDLQINLLAEEEMTAVLKTVSAIADHLGLPDVCHDSERDALIERTDVAALAEAVDEAAKEPSPTRVSASEAP